MQPLRGNGLALVGSDLQQVQVGVEGGPVGDAGRLEPTEYVFKLCFGDGKRIVLKTRSSPRRQLQLAVGADSENGKKARPRLLVVKKTMAGCKKHRNRFQMRINLIYTYIAIQ